MILPTRAEFPLPSESDGLGAPITGNGSLVDILSPAASRDAETGQEDPIPAQATSSDARKISIARRPYRNRSRVQNSSVLACTEAGPGRSICSQNAMKHDLKRAQGRWPRRHFPSSLFQQSSCSSLCERVCRARQDRSAISRSFRVTGRHPLSDSSEPDPPADGNDRANGGLNRYEAWVLRRHLRQQAGVGEQH